MKLLLVEDDTLLACQLKWLLKQYKIHIAANAQQAIKTFIKIKPSVVILDLGLPPCRNTFIDIEKELKEKNLNAPTGMDIERGLATVKEETEKEVIKKALEQTNFNISQTARLLKLRRTSLYYFLNKYNIKVKR